MPGAWVRFDVRQAVRPILSVLAVWLALNVAFLVFFVRPRAKELGTLEAESQRPLQVLAEREADVQGREAFLADLQTAQSELERLRHEILSTRGRRMVEVELEVHRLAERFNINMERVQYQNSDLEDEELERLAMVVPLEGGYGNLRRFVQAVENSDKFLVIERVALGQGRQGGAMLQMDITLATYFDAPHLRQERQKPPSRARERA